MRQFLIHHSFLILCAYGILASLAFHYFDRLKEIKLLHLLHLFIFFGLAVYIWKGVQGTAGLPPYEFMEGVGMILIATACNFVVFKMIITQYVILGHRLLMSDDQIPVHKTYDKAEAAEKAEDYQSAIEIYKQELEQDPEDGEARRRLAEVHCTTGDYVEALDHFQAAVRHIKHTDQKLNLMIRMSDMIDDQMGDPTAAKRVLEELIEQYPDSRQAEFAKERIEVLKQRDGAGEAQQ